MIWVLDFSVKAGLLLAATYAVAFALRRSTAAVRHCLWVAALVGVAILALPVTMPKPVRIGVPFQFAVTSVSGAVDAHGRTWAWPSWNTIWMAGSALILLRLLVGLVTVAFWTRRARNVGKLLVSDRATTPLTWGVFRPVILFPAYVEQWSAGQCELALRHEQAHVARRDWLWQMLGSAINAVFWFHPLVWLANAELRREAEGAADDLVLASGADPSDYAGQLVQVARNIADGAPLAAVAMVRHNVLESRVREILDPLRSRGGVSKASRAALAVLIGVSMVPLMAMQVGSILQPRKAEPPSESVRPVAPKVASPAPKATAPVATRPAVPPVEQRLSKYPEDDGSPHRMDERGMQAPLVIYKEDPPYTEEARVAKLQGTVVLAVVIDAQGRVEEARVVKSLDPGLDEQAIDTVRRWRFSAATKDGEPVRVNATIEINFRLL